MFMIWLSIAKFGVREVAHFDVRRERDWSTVLEEEGALS